MLLSLDRPFLTKRAPPANPILHRHAGESLGLHNIAQRLHLVYGKDSGLSVDGSPGQGLVVTLSIHLQRKGD